MVGTGRGAFPASRSIKRGGAGAVPAYSPCGLPLHVQSECSSDRHQDCAVVNKPQRTQSPQSNISPVSVKATSLVTASCFEGMKLSRLPFSLFRTAALRRTLSPVESTKERSVMSNHDLSDHGVLCVADCGIELAYRR